MKKLPAIIAALATSGVILGTILVVGVNSYVKNVYAATPASEQASTQAAGASAEVAQLKDLVAQYQAREAQYKKLLDQAQSNTSQVESQLQQYQNLFVQLQQLGVIRLDGNGQVSVFSPRSRSFFDDN